MKTIGTVLLSFLFYSHFLISQEEESKPLLRVFPIFRREECDWAIRMDICYRCLEQGERYAQRIRFFENEPPYREHGCYTDTKGFYPLIINDK